MVIIKRRSIPAHQIRDGIFLDFDDGVPQRVSDVKHLAARVLFTASGTQYSLEQDEHVSHAVVMRLVGEEE